MFLIVDKFQGINFEVSNCIPRSVRNAHGRPCNRSSQGWPKQDCAIKFLCLSFFSVVYPYIVSVFLHPFYVYFLSLSSPSNTNPREPTSAIPNKHKIYLRNKQVLFHGSRSSINHNTHLSRQGVEAVWNEDWSQIASFTSSRTQVNALYSLNRRRSHQYM